MLLLLVGSLVRTGWLAAEARPPVAALPGLEAAGLRHRCGAPARRRCPSALVRRRGQPRGRYSGGGGGRRGGRPGPPRRGAGRPATVAPGVREARALPRGAADEGVPVGHPTAADGPHRPGHGRLRTPPGAAGGRTAAVGIDASACASVSASAFGVPAALSVRGASAPGVPTALGRAAAVDSGTATGVAAPGVAAPARPGPQTATGSPWPGGPACGGRGVHRGAGAGSGPRAGRHAGHRAQQTQVAARHRERS